MKNMAITRAFIVIVLAIIISIPIMVFTKVNATADSTSSAISSFNDDYVFFVVEEGQTPLASMPTASHSSNVSVIVSVTTICILALAYAVYCFSLYHNASVIATKLPVYLRGNVKNTNAFLHPLKSYHYIKEAEYNVAQKYVYNEMSRF